MTLRTLVLLALGICLWATAPSSAKPQAAAPKPASIARTPSAPRTIVPTKPAAAPKPLAAPRVASKPPVQINPPRGQNLALKPTPASNVKPPVTLGQPKPAPAGIVRPPVSLNQPKPAAPKPANIAKPGANTVKPGQGKTPVVGSNANRSGTIGGNSMTANTGKTPGTAKPQTQKPASSDRIWGPRYGDDNRRLNPRPSKPLPAPYSPTNPEPGIQPSWGIDSLIPLMRFPLTRFSAPASAARTAPPARLPAPPASTIVGSRSTQMGVALGRSVNSDTVIGGRMYVGHALDRMMGRGVPPSVVENTIRVGQRFPGRTPDRTVFRDVRNSVQVIVETSSGRVITVE